MSQYPIVKYQSKVKPSLNGVNFDKKTIGKFLFLGTTLILLFCCIYLPFKGIRYNSNTNSLADNEYAGVSIIQPKKVESPKVETAIIKDAPVSKDIKEIKPSIIPTINFSFWPKMRFPDLISPISNSFNQITQGISQVEKAPAKSTETLDIQIANNTGFGPSNLSIDPFASNSGKIQAVSGDVIWQDGVNYTVKSDKFMIKSSLNIKSGGKEQILIVDNSGLLPANAILAVNKETFIKLGGDPNTQTTINAVVKTR